VSLPELENGLKEWMDREIQCEPRNTAGITSSRFRAVDG
jgi:hypothetical protein